MDGNFYINLDEVIKSIDTSEVLCLFFPTLRKSVVIDTRFTIEDGPMVRIMPMVSSPDERLRSIKRLRPHLLAPKSVTLIPWLRYVDSLVGLGAWDRIVQRFVDSGHRAAVRACAEVLEELRRLEREELAAVVRGDSYHTVWAREQ